MLIPPLSRPDSSSRYPPPRSWVPPGTTGYHRVPPGTTGYHRVPPGTKIGQICDCCPLFTAVTYFIHSECGHAARQRRDNRKTAVNLCNKPLALRLDLDRNHIRDIDMHRPPNEHVYRHGYGHGPHKRDIDMHGHPNEHVYRHGYGHGPHEGHRHA